MKSTTRKHDSSQPVADTAAYLFDDWFDPIETCVRERVREFIGGMIEGELDATLLRPRYGRLPKNAALRSLPPTKRRPRPAPHRFRPPRRAAFWPWRTTPMRSPPTPKARSVPTT